MPSDADPALRESIRNWKRDWNDLRARWAERKRHSTGRVSEFTAVSGLSGVSTEPTGRT